MRSRAKVVIATVALLAVAACSDSKGAPKPTTTLPPPPPTSTSSTVAAAPGNPRSTTTVPTEISPGDATVNGTVAGPDGPVAEATVRVERLIGDDVTTLDVKAVGGAWELPHVRGGRYRVRAWHPPDLAQLEPEVFFLGATEAKQVNLILTRFGDVSVTATSDPAPLPIGQPATLVTQVVSGSVDTQGIVRANPRPGLPVQLVPASGLALDGPDRQVTDGEGNTSWRVRCLAPGPPPVALVVGTARFPVTIPACNPG